MHKLTIVWLVGLLLSIFLPLGASAFIYAPCCLKATSINQNEIDLRWVAVSADPPTTGYIIERSPAGEGFTTIATNITGITYADKSLSAGINYTYRVSAVNATDGTGPASNPSSATTRSTPIPILPERPKDLMAKLISISKVSLSWTAVTNLYPILGYKIEKESPYGSGFDVLVRNTSSTATTYVDTNLSIGVTYNYRVSAINLYGGSLPSIPANIAVPSIPDTPRNASLSPQNGKIIVSWNPPLFLGGGLSGYIVSILDSTTTVKVPSTATSTTLGGLVNGNSYTITVGAETLAGRGPVISAGTATPAASIQASNPPAVTSTTQTATSSTTTTQIASNQQTYVFTNNLWRGIRSPAVSELQKRLKKEGFFSGDATGYFGLVTEASLRVYQKSKNILQTGTLGPLTRASLNKSK